MGFYREAVAVNPRAKGKLKIRLADSLGVISLTSQYPSTSSPSPSSPVNINLVPSSAPMLPAATPTTSPTGTSSISPSQVTNPVTPGGVYQAPDQLYRTASGLTPTNATPTPPPSSPSSPGTPFDSGPLVPIVGAVAGPAAGAAAALVPAFAQAANGPEMTRIAFDDSTPDVSLPEVYNADGTPVTPAAQAQTILQKISALPPAAKVGGAVLLFILFSRKGR